MAPAKGDEQDTEVAALHTLLGEDAGFLRVSRPVFHRIDTEPRASDRFDNVRAMVLQVKKRGGDENSIRRLMCHFARTPWLEGVIGLVVLAIHLPRSRRPSFILQECQS